MTQTNRLPNALLLAGLAGALSVLGCNKEPGKAEIDFRNNREGKGTPVATFGKDSITAEELKDRFAEMSPFARAGFESNDKRKEFVDGIARFELLAAEALAQGLQNDPEVVHAAKTVMVQRLIRKEFDEKPSPLPDSEVAAYYEQHKGDYVKPELLRLSILTLNAEEKSPAREEKKKKAQKLLTEARAMQPLDYNAFAKLVADNTEDEKTKPLRGDLRFLSLEDIEQKYGKQIHDAAKGLTQMGQLSEVIETPTGFHILKLHGRQNALNLSVDQVKSQIQTKLLAERRTGNFEKYIAGLKEKAGYKVDESALSKIEIDYKSPPKDNKRPPPGYIPSVAAGAPVQ